MPKGTIKADVMLSLDGWIDETEPPILSLVGSEDDLPVGTTIMGTIEVSATRFYQIMDAQKSGGKLPCLRLVVIDPDAKVVERKLEEARVAKENQAEFGLKKKGDNPPDDKPQTTGEKAAAVRKAVEDEKKAEKPGAQNVAAARVL